MYSQYVDIISIPWLHPRSLHKLLSGLGRYRCQWPHGFGLHWRAAQPQMPDVSDAYSDSTHRHEEKQDKNENYKVDQFLFRVLIFDPIKSLLNENLLCFHTNIKNSKRRKVITGEAFI